MVETGTPGVSRYEGPGEVVAEHAGDRALVERIGGRSRVGKTDEELRGEREQLDARRRHDVTDRLGAVTRRHAGGVRPLRRHRASRQRRGHRGAGVGRRAAAVRGRSRLFAEDRTALPEIFAFLSA